MKMKNRLIRDDMLATEPRAVLAQTTGSRGNISADGGVDEGVRPRLRQKQAFRAGSRQLMMSTVAFLSDYQRGPLVREFSREINCGIRIEAPTSN